MAALQSVAILFVVREIPVFPGQALKKVDPVRENACFSGRES